VYKIINVGMLERFEPNTVIDPEFLKKQGLLKTRLPLKILGEGEITKPFTVRAHKFSKKAKEKIEACNGKVEEIKL
jgi:large subunit ribosomal protein L15